MEEICELPSEKNYSRVVNVFTVEPQWLKHFWDHVHLFEIWVVRTTEG